MSSSFKIGTIKGVSTDARLLIEINQHGISYIVIDNDNECVAVNSHHFAPGAGIEKAGDELKRLVADNNILQGNFKEFKGTTILYITTENLIAFIKNYKLFDKWMYKVNEGSVRLVKKITDNDYYVLMTMSAPFIKSRESITHFRFNAPDNKGAILINLDAAPNLLPLNDNYIRIPRMEAFFKLVPLGNGKIEFTHFASSSPGGSIPDAIANWGAVDAPYYMLEKLKELLK